MILVILMSFKLQSHINGGDGELKIGGYTLFKLIEVIGLKLFDG